VVRLDRERGQQFGAGHVIDILLGRKTPRVARYGHHSLATFGAGADLREAQWRGVVRQLLAQGLLAIRGDYGVLALTEASYAVLRGQRKVALRHDPERPAGHVGSAQPARAGRSRAEGARASAGHAGPAAVDLDVRAAAVFERLRAWRAAAAKEQGVPAYVIFHDATLRQIAAESPSTLAALAGVNGVGEHKLARYGQQILDALAGDLLAGGEGPDREGPDREGRPA
jgi:ATP-dependent DNA helicase RecQ